MSFASLKKASSKGDTFAKLSREIDKLNQPAAGSSADERFWKPELDKLSLIHISEPTRPY